MDIQIGIIHVTLDDPCLKGFQVKEFVGSGTYGSVYVACDVKNTCEYVVKAQLLKDADDVDDFTAETTFATLASKAGYGPKLHLEHRCALQCDKKGTTCTTLSTKGSYPQIGLLVMDKYDTEYDELTKADQARLLGALRVLVLQMHRSGVVHSDLLGKNVMVKGKDVRLIDWGLSFSFQKNAPKKLTWAYKNETVHDWFDTVVTRYMVPWFDQYYARPALEVVLGVLQWNALGKGGVDYQSLILAPNPNETVKTYMGRADKGSHYVFLDWALPYTQWLRHGGMVIKVYVSASIGSSKGQRINVYVKKEDTVARMRTQLLNLLQTDLYQNQTILSVPTFRFGKHTLKPTDVLKQMDISHGSTLREIET